MKYRLEHLMNPDSGDIVLLRHPQYGLQVWAVTVIHKVHYCAECGSEMAPGLTVSYHPLTKSRNAKERICLACMRKLLAEYDGREAAA